MECGATEAADFVMLLYHFKARQLVARGERLETKVNRPDPALTEAVAAYREAIEVEPECGPSVYCHLSRALKWLGQHDAAADIITKCRDKYKTDPCVILFYCLAKVAATDLRGVMGGGGGKWKCPSVLWQLRFAVAEALQIAMKRGPGFSPRAPLSEDLLHLHDVDVVKVGVVLAAAHAREGDPTAAAELLTGLVEQLPRHIAAISSSGIATTELHELLRQARELLMPVLLDLDRADEAAAVGEEIYAAVMSTGGGTIAMDVHAIDNLITLCRALVRASENKSANKKVSAKARLGAALYLRVDRDVTLDKANKAGEKVERLAEAEAVLRDTLACEPEGEVTPPRNLEEKKGAAAGAGAGAGVGVAVANGPGGKVDDHAAATSLTSSSDNKATASSSSSSSSVGASSNAKKKTPAGSTTTTGAKRGGTGAVVLGAAAAKIKVAAGAAGALMKAAGSGGSSPRRGSTSGGVTTSVGPATKATPHRPGGGGPKIIPKPPPSALKKAKAASSKAAAAAVAVSKPNTSTRATPTSRSASKMKSTVAAAAVAAEAAKPKASSTVKNAPAAAAVNGKSASTSDAAAATSIAALTTTSTEATVPSVSGSNDDTNDLHNPVAAANVANVGDEDAAERELGMCSGRSITARIELAKVLRERLGFGNDGVFIGVSENTPKTEEEEERENRAVEEVCQLYREVTVMSPRNVDAVTGLAAMLEKKVKVKDTSLSSPSFEAALAVLAAYPDPVANDGAGDFDDSFVHVEIIRLIVRAAEAEEKSEKKLAAAAKMNGTSTTGAMTTGKRRSSKEWYELEQLEKSMVIAGRVMGMQGIEKWVEMLDGKGKWDCLMRIYAAVNKHLEPNMLQAHFQIKGWNMHQ